MPVDTTNMKVIQTAADGVVTRQRPVPEAGELRQLPEGATGGHFAQLNEKQQAAVNWQANKNLRPHGGEFASDFAKDNPELFLENSRQSIAKDPVLTKWAEGNFKESPEYNKSVAQDVVGALVERGMINLKGVNFVCDADIDKPRDGGFECKAPPRSAEKFEEKKSAQEERQ